MPSNLEPAHVPHLVNGLSLEITRQADRIRRRSHGRDWPGAASAMTELEEVVSLLGEMVNASLREALSADPQELVATPVVEVPIGQYL